MEIGEADNPADMLKGLQVTSYDNENDDDDDAEPVEEDPIDEEDEDDDGDEEQEPVTLGFLEKPKNNWSLLRQLFPSKAGGVPAWLVPDELPSGRACVCDICGEPLQFLLQVYAPLSDKESTFHRILYLFMCPSMACLLRDQHEQWKRCPEEAFRSVKVFRSQLPRYNAYYSSDPPKHDGTDKPSSSGAALCDWCGTWKGNKVCGNCKRVRYCSEKHQVMHWRSGHKAACQRLSISPELSESSPRTGETASAKIQSAASKNLWPEFEIVNEDESEYDAEMSDDNSNANALVSSKNNEMDESMKSLINSFEGDGDRRSWATFQERISKAPEQILRYCRNVSTKPLWPMLSGLPSRADIPRCSYCGGPRCFEFQVLPQLLYYFGVKNDADSLDWAIIVVYTCEASCEGSLAYKEEVAWVQLAAPTSSPIS
ncbi:programmed cell death protein 2-like [Punica granatum]|uniref:Programmed cell death protein 2-like n=1 Tax=Punica granatum TaxID=22663 RepID=A0A6P8C2F3_PUNGR|nr:programmed cell death protein 2-like [Punica granatum]